MLRLIVCCVEGDHTWMYIFLRQERMSFMEAGIKERDKCQNVLGLISIVWNDINLSVGNALCEQSVCSLFPLPACITQWLECSTWKIEVVGLITVLVNLTIIDCLSVETLNRGPVWRSYTPSILKNQLELSVVSSCILALFSITTNRLLGVSLRWATGSNNK